MRLAFAGTSQFAAGILAALCEQAQAPRLVITKEDSRAGRGKQYRASAVAHVAESHSLPTHKPTALDAAVISAIADFQPDLMLVVAYGKIIPTALLTLPQHGCWNVHTSLLPHYRGAAPIERALLDGVHETGVTLMQMDEGLDTGNIICQTSFAVAPADNKASVSARMMSQAITLVQTHLAILASGGRIASQAQDHSQASYANKLRKEELWIDWHMPAAQVQRQIHALYPDARSRFANTVVKLLSATPTPQSGTPGTIIAFDKEGLVIACGDGAIRLEQAQPAGKKPLDIAAFYNGYKHVFTVGRTFNLA